jgi:hypothetical protein
MKKFFATLVILFISVSAASAQFANIGVKGQIGYATLGGDAPPVGQSWESLQVFGGGGFVTYRVEPIDIAAEVLYNQEGSSVSYRTFKINTTASIVEVNLLAKYPAQKGGGVLPVIYAGPTVASLSKVNQHSESGVLITDTDLTDKYNKTEFGVIIGGGASYVAGGGRILVDVRYKLGLSNINKDAVPAINNTNRVFSISIGYAINLM